MMRMKRALVAFVAAGITEAALATLFFQFGHIGGDGPDIVGAIGIILHFPGIIIADHFQLRGTIDTVFIVFTGFLQFFMVFWVASAIWSRRRKTSVDP